MRHKKAGRQFGRDTSSRRAMLRNLTANLITHERIETTDAKAKALRPVIDRIIVTAKKNTLASKRQVAVQVHVPEVFKKLYAEILPHFQEKNSGFTRVIKLGVRRGDGAEMSVVELLTPRPVEVAADKEKKDKEKGAKGFMAKAREAAAAKKAPAKKVAKKAAKAK